MVRSTNRSTLRFVIRYRKQDITHVNILGLDDMDGGRIDPAKIGYAMAQELDILLNVSEVDMKSKYFKKHMP